MWYTEWNSVSPTLSPHPAQSRLQIKRRVSLKHLSNKAQDGWQKCPFCGWGVVCFFNSLLTYFGKFGERDLEKNWEKKKQLSVQKKTFNIREDDYFQLQDTCCQYFSLISFILTQWTVDTENALEDGGGGGMANPVYYFRQCMGSVYFCACICKYSTTQLIYNSLKAYYKIVSCTLCGHWAVKVLKLLI